MLLLEEKGGKCRREELLGPIWIYLFHENVKSHESLIALSPALRLKFLSLRCQQRWMPHACAWPRLPISTLEERVI